MANYTYVHDYSVFEFGGILQNKDGSLLPVNTAEDARNMDTADGNLSVAKGFEHIVEDIVPDTGKIIKLIIPKGYVNEYYVICEDNIYAYYNGAWHLLYTFDENLKRGECDFVQTKISNRECIVLATGETQMLKLYLDDHSVSLFGTGLYIIDESDGVTVRKWEEITDDDGTVLDYVMTLSRTLTAEEWRRAYCDGVYYGKAWYGDILADEDWQTGTDKLYFYSKPNTIPQVGDSIRITGGASTASVAYIDTMYNRLFSAGDPDAPSRLYWSAVPGDGRTIEDWLTVDGSQDASGGYVEIGETDGDEIVSIEAMENYILINKRYSSWRLYGNRPSTFTVERVDKNGLEMNHASVVTLYNQPMWFTKEGVMRYTGTIISNLEAGISGLRKFLKEELDSVSHSRGCIADHRVYFSCRTKDAENEYDNAIVTFDETTGSYMVRDGFVLCDITAEDGKVYLATPDRHISQFEVGTSYAGGDINAYWKTQPTDLNAKYYSKHLRKITMRATGERMEIFVYGDHHQRQVERLLNPEDENGYFVEPLNFDLSKRFQFEFRNVNGSHFCIEGGFEVQYETERKAGV